MLPTEDLFVYTYVLVDDAICSGAIVIAPRPGPAPACTDAELLAVALVNLLAGWLALSRYSRNPFHSTLLGSVMPDQFAGTVILSLYVYSLTYSLTAVLRNGLKGLGASMGIVFGLPFLAIAVRWRWHINLPIPTSPIGNLSLLVSNMIWIFITLLFVFASQMVIERAEM